MPLQFTLQKTDAQSAARAGEIITDHGKIQTPIFMPVGTVGSVKTVHPQDLKNDIKAEIILGNTYHLYLRPGLDILKKAGGLHKFNGWDGPILTDSGGFQVYSLKGIRKIHEDGVEFRSHIDGSKHFFTPEFAVDIQRVIGADIIMGLDECTPYPCTYNYAKRSLDRTMRWLNRCKVRMNETTGLYGYEQNLFPIVQGSTYDDLRKRAAEEVAAMDCPGNAIGGMADNLEHMYHMTDVALQVLPKEKPRYLMGVGTPVNILEGIAMGIDMFDCVMPTRNARNGMLFTKNGVMNMKNAKWKEDFSPLDPEGTSFVDNFYSKAYVRHLFVSNELLAGQIASLHNLSFYLWLVKEARKEILADNFKPWKEKMVKQLSEKL
jgi:queuine tRNA-ribosyltransferase